MSASLIVVLALAAGEVESAAADEASRSGARFSFEHAEEGVLVREGDRKVLFYQKRPKSLDGRYQRANYVHPLYGLDGEVLTEDFPDDHRHHRGIFWAWHQLWAGDTRLGDGWTTETFQWKVESVEARQTEDAAELRLRVFWNTSGLGNRPNNWLPRVEERTTIRVHRGSDALRKIDFDIRLRAVTPDVRLGGSDDEKGYGGFSVRVRLPEDLRFIGSEGPVEPQTTTVEAGPWLNLATEDRGLAILTHPSNPGFPQPWILRRQRSMQNPAWPGREPVALSQDEPLVLRYRLVLHRGQLDRADIDALHAEYGREAEKPLNVVFFLVDDLGYMDVGCNNPETFYETRNVDRLARSGMRFTDGYAANPVCSPTRYSIMTGKHPSRVDATNFFSGDRAGRFLPAPLNDRMPLEEITIAEALKEHGYATFFAGKWHLGPSEEYWPEHQGFDVNKGGWRAGAPAPRGGRYFSPYNNPRLEDGREGEHLPDRLAAETTKFIEQHRDGPFFAYLSFYSVHTPLMAPKELVDKYRRKAERLGLADREQFADEEQVWPTDEPRRVRTVQAHAIYAAMMESMDRAVGRVLDKLDELGLADSTAVFFMSDNGGLSTAEGSPTSNLPLRGGKGWLYEGGIREPFLIRWPGVTQPGSTCRVPVISTDFHLTILDMAGLPLRPEQHRDGVSLVPLLKGAESLPRKHVYWHYPHYSNQGGFPGGAIRSDDWKLIERFEDGRVHLYNLRDDVGERHDLAGKYPDRVSEMRNCLHEWYREVDAKFLRAQPDGPEPWRP